MRYKLKGKISTDRPTLFLVNHISYLDIFVLGSVIPGYFIAKSEVANWPILGPLAKVQNTLFFERKGRKVRSQLTIMTNHFDNKGNLILFPEGTSTEGEHVEPFKSSLLQSIEQSKTTVQIQPVTIAYTRYQDEPMDRSIRDHYAWYATMPFASHFFSALGMGKSQVEVIFHPSVTLGNFETRKECAQHCWQTVSESLTETLSRQ
jgi:1-acyl-sn-glycerol-3-phosphate acyltransferase